MSQNMASNATSLSQEEAAHLLPDSIIEIFPEILNHFILTA